MIPLHTAFDLEQRTFLVIWPAIALQIVYMFTGAISANAQDGYSLMGSARLTSLSDCYQLTPALDGQTGAVWFDKRLRLSESFELSFSLNFGANNRHEYQI